MFIRHEYVKGYQLHDPSEFLQFGRHKWYLESKGGYIVLPHWWGTHLNISTAWKYIERGVWVAIQRR